MLVGRHGRVLVGPVVGVEEGSPPRARGTPSARPQLLARSQGLTVLCTNMPPETYAVAYGPGMGALDAEMVRRLQHKTTRQ